MGILTATAALLDVPGFLFRRNGDGLPVGHLGLADVGVDPEFTGQAVDDDFQMQFAHPGDQGLVGLFIGLDPERKDLPWPVWPRTGSMRPGRPWSWAQWQPR
jgi:hypothetical protein